MTYREAVKNFKRYYRKLYIERSDYWTAQLAWADYIDGLNREREITDKQASTWPTPFPYGKKLKPSKRQLEYEVYKID